MKFSIKEAFKSAFKIFGQNFFVVFSLWVFLFATAMGVAFLSIFLLSIKNTDLVRGLGGLTVLPILPCLVNAFLPVCKGSEIKFRNCFPSLKKVFNFLLGCILLSIPIMIFVSIATIADIYDYSSIVIAVFYVASFRYYIFYVQEVLCGNSILQSFRNSAKLASGNICKLFLTIFLTVIGYFALVVLLALSIMIVIEKQIFIGWICAAPLFIALFFITPLSVLVWTHVYTQLLPPESNPLLKKTKLETKDNATDSTEKELV